MGGLVMVLGTVVAIWPERRPHVPAHQPTARQVEMTATQETGL